MPGLSVTFVGGPTALLQYAGLRLLTDPTFDPPGEYPDPGSTTLVKTAGPALPVERMLPLDAILLSHHEHEDNLDHAGRALIDGGIRTITTPYAAARLGSSHVVGLEPWESAELYDDVTVTAMPGRHGPVGTEEWVGPVCGFLLRAPGRATVYVSGDNAGLDIVDEIAERVGPVDVAVLFAGAARVAAIDAPLTLTSADAAEAARRLGARAVVGLHCDDWQHFSESRADLEAAFAAAGIGDLLVPIPRGERVEVPLPPR